MQKSISMDKSTARIILEVLRECRSDAEFEAQNETCRDCGRGDLALILRRGAASIIMEFEDRLRSSFAIAQDS